MPKRPAAAVAAAAAQAFPRRRRLRGKQAAADYEALPAAGGRGAEATPAIKRPAANAAVRRRPAGEAADHPCHGRDGQACVFSTCEPGARARYHDSCRKCPWCDATLMGKAMDAKQGRVRMSSALELFWASSKEIFKQAAQRLPAKWRNHFPLQALGLSPAFHSDEALRKALSSAAGRGRLLSALRKRYSADPEVAELAIKVLPPELQEEMRTKAAEEPRRAREARAKAQEEPMMDQWEKALAARRSIRAPATEEARATLEERVAEDRARVRRKFFP
eukprot:s5533_g2.t1